MKVLKIIGKILGILAALAVVCCIVILIIFRNEVLTIASIEKIDDYPIYTMDYKGTYWFEEFMETNGMVSHRDFSAFFMNKVTRGLVENDGKITPRKTAMCTCFVCRNENGDIIYGRNLEQGGYCPPVVVSTHAGKYDTIGTAFLVDSNEEMPELKRKIDMLTEPYFTADGMNEAGVAISLLSVPYSILPDNGDVPLLSADQVCRLVLDQAGSVDEAVELFSKFNLDASPLEQLSACHFLIADRSGKMVVVELHNGKTSVVLPIHDNYMTVTNFYLNDEISSGIGQARYKYIEKALEEKQGVLSEEEALELLASVKDPHIHAEWTSIYNLTTGDMYIMPKSQLDRVHRIR